MRFKIGDKVRVKKGDYRITTKGSEGVILGFDGNKNQTVRIDFYSYGKLSKNRTRNVYSIKTADIKLIDCYKNNKEDD